MREIRSRENREVREVRSFRELGENCEKEAKRGEKDGAFIGDYKRFQAESIKTLQ